MLKEDVGVASSKSHAILEVIGRARTRVGGN